jgi:tetratricopeptide (TPR) repeat protein
MKRLLLITTLLFSILSFSQKEEMKTLKKLYSKEKPSPKDVENYKTALSALQNLAKEENDKVYANFYKGMLPMFELTSLGEKAASPAEQMKLFTPENLNNFFIAVTETKDYEAKTGVKIHTEDINKTLSFFNPLLSNAGFQLISANQFKQASDVFYLLYKLDKKNGINLDNAARLAYQAEEYLLSEKLFDEYIESDYFKTGVLYYAINLASGKEELFPDKSSRSKVLTLKTHEKPRDEKVNNNSAEIYKIVADLASFNGNKEKAKKYFDLALEKTPDDSDLLKLVSNFYLQLGYDKIKDEESLINELNKNSDNKKVFNELMEKRKNLFRDALPNFETAYKFDKENIAAKEILKATYEILEMKDKASKL